MKRKFTEIPVTIITDDEHKTGDNLEMTRQRIERAAMYLMSFFNILKICAIDFEGQAESREMSGFFEDINNHCAVGYAIAASILASAANLTEFIPDEYNKLESVKDNEDTEKYTGDLDIDNLALSISGLMNNPNLPKPLRKGFDEALVEFINSQLGHDEFNDDFFSGEYIARHLKVYKEAGDE